ncbi:MAG TPA: glycosyltransferase family 2 protein [Acidobacteriaceae bacterium]|nr:glycosyltransferase family 2 protein [Acidobacteriaceae bacterium]
MPNITVSIVTYRNTLRDIAPLLQRLHDERRICRWVVVDNGDSEEIARAVRELGGIYVRTGRNAGFGGGHNRALKELASVDSKYHAILNPDVSFDADVLPELTNVMEARPDVGLIMPKIIYPDGRNQYLCKLLPAPVDLVLRRFLPGPLKRLAQNRIASFELRNLDYDAPAYVPSLSGCFMFTRRSVLEEIGGFDERFFLYMEDVDLCRRMLARSRLLYWPQVTIEHVHQMGSYRNRKLLLLHVRSAIKYFNKWGWLRDRERSRMNWETLQTIPRRS